jgi:hypothetical protein
MRCKMLSMFFVPSLVTLNTNTRCRGGGETFFKVDARGTVIVLILTVFLEFENHLTEFSAIYWETLKFTFNSNGFDSNL